MHAHDFSPTMLLLGAARGINDERLGPRLLRSAWICLNTIWAAALIAATGCKLSR